MAIALVSVMAKLYAASVVFPQSKEGPVRGSGEG